MAVKEIIGTNGNDKLIGTDGNDKITGKKGDDTIYGGLGNDTITAGKPTNINTINFAKGDGNDTIILTKYEDTVINLYENYNPSTNTGTYIDFSDIKFQYSANKKDLIIYFDEAKEQGSITLKDYAIKDFSSNIYLHFKPNEEYEKGQINIAAAPLINVDITKNYTGTFIGENINASEATKGLSIDGKGGVDSITGSNYSDTIKGDGYLYGEGGNDKIYGGNLGAFIWGGDGNDTIYGTTARGGFIFGGEGNDVIYSRSKGYGDLIGGKGDDIFNNSGKGIRCFHFAKGDGNDTINLAKNEEIRIALYETLDEETGSGTYVDKDNIGYRYSENGKDLIIYIDKTDETQGTITLKNYISNNITKSAKLYLGKDSSHREIYIDLKDVLVEKNILNKNFNGSWMNDKIDASDSTKNLTIKGGNGDDVIQSGKGNDKIYGDNGDDFISGGEGNDTITGGKGHNGIAFVKDNGDDVINLTKDEKLDIVVYEKFDLKNDDCRPADITKLGYEYVGKDLKIWYNKENHSEGSIILKDYASKDVTDGIKIYGKDFEGNNASIDLNKVTIKTNILDKNFTGSWMKDSIDASSATKNLTLNGGDSEDTIKGGEGNDKIYGGADKDSLEGGAGNDTIYGDDGDDIIRGKDGNDVIYGGNGEDDIIGGKGNDTITGGNGVTHIGHTRGDGDDVVYLTKGENLNLNLGEENTSSPYRLLTKSEVSYKYSDDKKDLIIYSDKNDESKGSITLKNFATKDILNNATKKTPDTSSIKIHFSEGAVDVKQVEVETETNKNFTGTWLNDKIDASGYTLRDKNGFLIENPSKKGLTLNGGAGKDSITGTNYSDVIKGGDGDDDIYGGKGNDKVYGENGDDYILGGEGNDTIYGGNGQNGLFGETGNDVIYGGADFDFIVGGKGNDTITGGKGENIIIFAKGDENDVVNLTKGEKLEIKLFEKYDNVNKEYILADIDKVGYEYSSNKKDLILYIDKTDKTQGSITLKNFVSKDVTNEIKIIGKGASGDEVIADLKKDNIVTKETDKNFTGTWLNDSIDASDTILYKKAGKTTVEKETKDKGLTLDGAKGNDVIMGTKYSDVLKGGSGNDTITGGAGNDTITGGVGENTLYYKKGDGNDTINLIKGENFKLVLSDVTDVNNVLVERSKNGKDVLIYADKENKNEYITLKNYAVKDITNNSTKKLEDTSSVILQIGEDEYDFRTQFGFSAKPTKNFTGTWMTDNIDASEYQLYDKKHNEINDSSKKGLTLDSGAGNDVIKGTKYSDVLKGGDGYDVINGGKGNDTIYGGNDINELYGDEGNDVIYGGADDDTIDGGAGNDTITGGKGTNKIIYRHGEGNDVVKLTKGEDLIIALPNVDKLDDIIFEIAPNGKDLIIKANNANRDEFMTIKDYVIKDVLNSGKFLLGESEREEDFSRIKINVDTTKNFTGTRLNEEIKAIEATKGVTINSGAGNDTVKGSDYNDVIKGTSGSKEFFGGKGNDTIYGTNDYNNLNGGEDDDKIYAGNLQDFIYGDVGNDFIKGGDGDDEIWGDSSSASENDGNDTIYGEGGNDKIFGGGGDDYIDGGAGDDIIYSDGGNDTIVGGTGANKIIYKTGYGNDTIILTKGEDLTIDLRAPEDKSDVKLAYAENGKDLLIYPLKDQDEYITIKDFIVKDVTNSITLDINGNRYDLKTGKNITNPTQKPIFVTTYAESNVTGTWMADELDAHTYTKYNETGTTNLSPELEGLTLDGGAGDDTIIGSRYCDTIKGGDGNDTIDATIGGNDTIYGGKGDDSITCGSGKDLIYGEDGNDNLSGYNDDDTIYGGEGNDSLYGGMGADSLYGDSGDDYIDAGQGDDLVYGGDGNDNLIGRFGNDTIYGEGGDDKIWGDEGNDTIYGGDGNDSIYGGADDDYIEGGQGNDTITGGTGANYIVYNSGDGDDIITLTKGEQFKLELKGVRSIDDVEFAIASNRRDYIIYVDKNNHSAGSITLKDFADRDVTNNATETTEDTSYVKLVINGTEYDLRKKDITATENYTGTWFYENIDASSATKGLNINSNGGNDTIKGSNYNDTIYGGEGNDSIKGNAGNNTLYGDDGNDTIYGGTGNDSIEGGAGDDKLYGGSGSCTIHGNTGNDTIWGSSTNGTIYGDEGNDELQGNEGADIIYGGIGNDYINGNQGNDTLYGGAGDDTLDGGYGSDTLYGGEGDDTYKVYFEKNAMNSVIVDESGTNDIVNFTEWPTGLETCRKDQLHLVFNVSKDFNKSTDTISWVNILDDTNFAAWKSNPTGDFDGVKIKDNAIETINSSDNYHVTSADIATLAESVAGWLTEKGYQDVNEALASENTADIEALIAKFNECNWQTTGV